MNKGKYPIRWLVIALLLLPGLAAAKPEVPVEAAVQAPQAGIFDRQDFAYQGIDEAACAEPANPVVAENCLPGTDDWIVQNYAGEIDVYTSTDSVTPGDQLDFYVDTPSPTFDLYIYRNGYYGGLGGRLVHEISAVRGVDQPGCARAEDTGLRTCSNWSISYTLPIPEDWVSGIYIVRIVRPDTGGENDTFFVVREDDRDSDILYQQSVTTFQAYNNYGGKSTYWWNSGTCNTIADSPFAIKVSLNRPYIQPHTDPNSYYRAEYPMMRWLEQQGYDVTYSTNMDTHRSGQPGAHNELLDHKIFLSVGHDEYWSQEMRDAITAARDAGIHLGFFSANTGYWRVRFEPDPLTNEPDSVMVNYKTTESGPPDPVTPTGTWRDPQGINNPENALFGIMYIGDNDKFYFPLRIHAEDTGDPIFRNTGLEDMPPGTYIDVGDQIVGWEWDAPVDNGQAPEGVTTVARTPVYGFLLADAGNFENGNLGIAETQAVRYTAPSGAIVFSTGTIQWSWGLGAQATNPVEADRVISQMTYNLLDEMGAQAASPADYIVAAGSNDTVPEIPAERFRTPGSARVPVISNIETVIDGTTVSVRWETDIPATAQLWYGLEPGHIIYTGGVDASTILSHGFTLEGKQGIQPRTTYYYRVASVSEDWGVAISDVMTFTTGSLSAGGEISNAVRPLVDTARCFYLKNTFGVMAGGAVVGVVVVFVVGRAVLRRRRRRAA